MHLVTKSNVPEIQSLKPSTDLHTEIIDPKLITVKIDAIYNLKKNKDTNFSLENN